MRSNLALPTYDSPKAFFALAPPMINRLYLLVEGNGDHKFWAANRRTGGNKRVTILPVNGRDGITGNPDKNVEGLPEFFEEFSRLEGRSEEQVRKQIIGIYDDDYEQILNPNNEGDPNVFSTSPPNNLEALIFDIWAKEGYPSIFFNRSMWSMQKKNVSKALGIARSVGILRAASSKNGWRLKFREKQTGIQSWLKAGVENYTEPRWVEQALIPKLMKKQNKNVRGGVSVNTVVMGYKEMLKHCEATPTLSLVNGHDLCMLVQLTNDGSPDYWIMEKELHLSQRWSNISKKTRGKIDLFQRLDHWSNDNESRMFKWQ